MPFSDEFLFGAATAAYQVEGAAGEDGRGLSIWDVFCAEPGHIYEQHTAARSCDHYHHTDEDLNLMAALGLEAYRFSVSWPRVLPEGTGKINERGLDFYERLTDALLERGITPCLTLYHWDLPYALYLKGGFLNPDSSRWFADYAALIAKRLGDRVKYFVTLNEPQCIAGLGYLTGEHAPGLKVGVRDFFLLWNNLLLSHGRAVSALRAISPDFRIGAASTGTVCYPADDSACSLEAAQKKMFNPSGNLHEDVWNIGLWTEPLYGGCYSEKLHELYAPYLSDPTEQEWQEISQKLDFHAQNIYHGQAVRADEEGKVQAVPFAAGFPRNSMGWPITPDSLYYGPKFLYERYHLPVIISENGMAAHDWPDEQGEVHDPQRCEFLRRYLTRLEQALSDGVDVAGYFVWSLLDNFEWSYGFSERFGLVHVDYETLRRTPKDSARWYAQTIKKRTVLQ
ncbi:MAG: beta-glucosidase [Succinivibrio sp.]|nr:beta-glucosidase [Succinivibrio sp.]